MANGKTFEIRHPEMVKLGRSFLLVFSFRPGEADIVERWETVSLMLIESISHLDVFGVCMITFQRLARYVGAEPFRPFRISMASGQTFEIRHPEMISVGRTTAHIYTYLSDDAAQAAQREHEVSLLLMESLEPLDPVAGPAS